MEFLIHSYQKMEEIAIDELDRKLLRALQLDASLSNQDLAAAVHASPATCLRRVRRLRELGLIARELALLDPQRLAQAQGHGLQAVVEISLDQQGQEHADAFAALAAADPQVQQCWQVSPGPDFVLVVQARDMPGYQALAQRLFTQHANVRNVKAFFCTRLVKFDPGLAVD
jgi:DNA-binding Lrp family transcriptional regulator